MIEEASTPLASALASALTEGGDMVTKAIGSTTNEHADPISPVPNVTSNEVKEVVNHTPEKMNVMQTRSSHVEQDDEANPIRYEETDPVIDSVLETVASDSDRVDHSLSNGGSGVERSHMDRKPGDEVDADGFRPATDSHDLRLYLPPPSPARGKVPHLSRPLYFELVTVPHLDGKCTLTNEPSAVEYFTNVRSTNYILHTEDISPTVLDGWLTGKKHWLRNDLKTRLIPTRHHSTLLAFVNANAVEMEENGLTINSSLEHNTISLNTEEGREDYQMMKIEL